MASIIRDPGGKKRILFVGRNRKRRAVRIGKVSQDAALSVKVKIERLVAASITGHPLDNETAQWVADLDDVMAAKLAKVELIPPRAAAQQTTLEAFLDAYIARRSDVKDSTATVYGHTRRCLIEHFGPDKALRDITPGDADEWRLYLIAGKLADNTVRRRCGIAKQFFRAAQRKGLITANPFAELKAAVQANTSRFYFITREEAQKVSDACPDTQWRLLFALCRYGGLRCPSEHVALKWGDVDWDRGRITVRSPKTEHHVGGESRMIPLFPELRPYLEQAWDEAPEGTEHVITMRRTANANLRTRFEKIIRRAGLKPWPKLFQNLRSTRETELAESFPLHVVTAWIGNSQPVAMKHYLQVTDEHFARGASGGAKSGALAAQQAGEPGCKQVNPPMGAGANDARIPEEFSTLRDDSELCTVGAGNAVYGKVGDEGLEPPTLSV